MDYIYFVSYSIKFVNGELSAKHTTIYALYKMNRHNIEEWLQGVEDVLLAKNDKNAYAISEIAIINWILLDEE